LEDLMIKRDVKMIKRDVKVWSGRGMDSVVPMRRGGSLWLFLLAAWVVAVALPGGTAAADTDRVEAVRAALERDPAPHPRLFFSEDEAAQVRERIEGAPLLRKAWGVIRDQADAMLDLEVSEREKRGRRLLGVSRTVLKRVTHLALAYRLTGERPYLERAQEEMVAAAEFSDWNPSHFLDVAEMTAALAIGYDWLHDDLDPAARRTIRKAIVEKGLKTSFEHEGWWVRTTNNWSQVCHGGLTMGALAVLEDAPEVAERILVRTAEHIDRPMDVYGPNGAYPEGPGYWGYGTGYNVLLIDALDSGLGTDLGLTDHERFMASPRYFLHVHGPTTKVFNYSDNSESSSVQPAMYWYARQLDEPSLLWMERRKLERLVRSGTSARGGGNRLLPFLLIWAEGLDEIGPPGDRHYKDEGKAPVGMHRSGWDAEATYVGLKGGTPSANHGQMDTGSFVMESDGVRWGIDLGVQNYHSLESAGIDLWNSSQNSERWTVFRLNNHSKNTLVVDGALQRVDGFAPIVSFAGGGAELPHTAVDLSEVYEGQLSEAARGVGLSEEGAVVVRDELRAPDRAVQVRWGMVTEAEVEIVADDRAVLRQNGERLGLRVDGGSAEIELETYETADPPADYDAPNPGTRMIGFTILCKPEQRHRLTVWLQPGGVSEVPEDPPALDAW
jgi:hypothetical protein